MKQKGQCLHISAKQNEELTPPKRPLRFDSRSEFALCELFAKYIPGWRPEMGKTVQIPIGNKSIDFMVCGDLVEYHPISINRELKSSRANQIFRRLYRKASAWEREQLCELLTEELSAQYEHRRGQLVQLSEHAGKHLYVCTSPWEVYRDIIRRLSPQPPQYADFKSQFYKLLRL